MTQQIDIRLIHTLRELDVSSPGLFRQILETFLQSLPMELHHLQESLLQGDAVALSQNAHRFKSSCQNLGATEMAQVLKTLELQAATLPAQKIVEMIHFLEKSSKQATMELSEYLK